jgi:hypothetical protein
VATIELLRSGQRVGRCTFDAVCEFLDLDLYDLERRGLTDHLRLEQPFQLITADGIRTLDPARSEDMSHAVALAWKTVATCVVFPDGRLELTFSDGTSVHAGPADMYEAWEYWGACAGGRVISAPGGQVVVLWDGGSAETHSGLDAPMPR